MVWSAHVLQLLPLIILTFLSHKTVDAKSHQRRELKFRGGKVPMQATPQTLTQHPEPKHEDNMETGRHTVPLGVPFQPRSIGLSPHTHDPEHAPPSDPQTTVRIMNVLHATFFLRLLFGSNLQKPRVTHRSNNSDYKRKSTTA